MIQRRMTRKAAKVFGLSVVLLAVIAAAMPVFADLIEPPSDFTVSLVGQRTVTMTWKAPEVSASGYTIQRVDLTSNEPKNFDLEDATSFTDNDVPGGGTTYLYRIRANTPAGSSKWSAPKMITIP